MDQRPPRLGGEPSRVRGGPTHGRNRWGTKVVLGWGGSALSPLNGGGLRLYHALAHGPWGGETMILGSGCHVFGVFAAFAGSLARSRRAPRPSWSSRPGATVGRVRVSRGGRAYAGQHLLATSSAPGGLASLPLTTRAPMFVPATGGLNALTRRTGEPPCSAVKVGARSTRGTCTSRTVVLRIVSSTSSRPARGRHTAYNDDCTAGDCNARTEAKTLSTAYDMNTLEVTTTN